MLYTISSFAQSSYIGKLGPGVVVAHCLASKTGRSKHEALVRRGLYMLPRQWTLATLERHIPYQSNQTFFDWLHAVRDALDARDTI